MYKVNLVDHEKGWISKFKKETTLLKNIFKDELIEIHHIGSTSILAIKSKPTIYIMPVVKKLERSMNLTKYRQKTVTSLGGKIMSRDGGFLQKMMTLEIDYIMHIFFSCVIIT